MKKLLFNFLYQSSYQVLTVLLPIITVPIVSHALGPEGIGAWNYTNSIVTYFILFAGLGLSNYAIREVAYVKNDKQKLSAKFFELQLFNLMFSLPILIVYLFFILRMPNRALFLIQSLMIFATIIDISWFFQGIEDFKKVSIRNIMVKIMTLVLIVIFIKEPNDLPLYALIISGSTVISTIILWVSLGRHINFTLVNMHSIMQHFVPSLRFLLLKISSTLFNSISKTLLGIVSGLVAVGIFSNSLTIIVMVGTIIHSLNIVMMPRMSSIYKRDGEEKLIQVLEKIVHLQFYLTIPMMFGVLAINSKIVYWLYGEGFESVKYLIPILAPVIVIQQYNQAVAHQYLLPKNEMKSYNLSMVIATIVNVLVCILLIPLINEYGAAIGFLLGQVSICIYRTKILINKSSFTFEIKDIILWMCSGMIMWGGVNVATQYMPPTIITTLIQVVIGIVLYLFTTSVIKANPLNQYMERFFSKLAVGKKNS